MAIYKKSNSGFLPFIQKDEVTSPFTDIQNRAKVDSSLKCIMGNERIMVNSLNELNKEFGPNGETVYEADSGDSRLRFVGEWTASFSATGLKARAAKEITSYVEISFYGTGLNLLSLFDTQASNELTVEIDGIVSTSIFYFGGTLLNGRSYKPNNVFECAKDLTLGWHTIKISYLIGDFFDVFGFEIINNASQISVKAGKAHGNGYEYLLESDQLIDYNLGFDNVLDINIGTRGGRSIIYLDPSNGSVKKRFTKTDIASAFLVNTDHTNEAPNRKLNFREFGRNRSDDFSTNGTKARVFTLDDGTHTLIGGTNTRDLVTTKGIDSIFNDSTGNTITLTFVGTGLDIFVSGQSTGVYDSDSVIVDGALLGNITNSEESSIFKIASGLPYGTHTVKFTRLAATGNGLHYVDFIVYQPKKPILPEGAVEIADYNVIADFVANTVSGLDTISTGIVRKYPTRELSYTNGASGGSNWTLNVFSTQFLGGFNIDTSKNGYFEYSFYGTGFDFRGGGNTNGSPNILVEINGLTANTTNFPTMTSSAYGTGVGFNSSTGIHDQETGSAIEGTGLIISNLPLKKYTVRLTNQNGNVGDFFRVNAFDIITPIYSPHTTFGSLSIRDIRNFDSMKDVNKIIKEKSIGLNISTTTDIVNFSKGVSQMLKVATGRVLVYYENAFNGKFVTQVNVFGNWHAGTNGGTATSQKHGIEIFGANSSHVYADATFLDADFKGKLEKDELEE